MCFNQTGDISTLGGSSLKQVDKFIYLGNSVSSTEKIIDTWLAKAWTANSRLSIDNRSYGNQTWPIKWNAASCRYCYMDALHGCWLNSWRKSLTATTQECCEQFWKIPGGNTPQSSSCTAIYLPSRKLSKLDEPDMQDTAGKAGGAHKWCTPMDHLTWLSKSRATSPNLHTAALWRYGM